jgi:hypothetical protein
VAPQTVLIPEEPVETKEYQKFDVSQCEIYGYILLSQPAHLKALDPISIGVLFKHNQRTYIRIKKLCYKLNYLMQFIEQDPETGFFLNKYSNLLVSNGV